MRGLAHINDNLSATFQFQRQSQALVQKHKKNLINNQKKPPSKYLSSIVGIKSELRVFYNLYIKFSADAVSNGWVIDLWKMDFVMEIRTDYKL